MAPRTATRRIALDGPLWDHVQPLLDAPGGVLLESRGPVEPFARWSLASADPYRVVAVQGDRVIERRPREGWSAEVGGDPLDVLAEVLPSPSADAEGPPRPDAFLYVGYEALGLFEDVPVASGPMPDVLAWFVDRAVVRDRVTGATHLVATDAGGEAPEAVLDDLADTLGPRPDGPIRRVAVESTHDRAAYADAVEAVREQVRAGDVFQVNIAQRFEASRPGEPLDVYGRLRRTNPGPFNAYADLGALQVASTSPERLIRLAADRVEARPIAGTRPRDPEPDRDDALARDLLSDDKEAAEHAMIVDLYRNDVSRIAEPGTVRVEPYRLLERYARVQHLTSNVVATPRDGVGPVDALAAAFPGGSITGAPKVRAMEIIEAVEPFARGPYTGSLGVFGPAGLDLSILIRTATFRDGRVRLSAGGGVVDGSDPRAEFDESLAKAQAMLDALGSDRSPPSIAYRGGTTWTLPPAPVDRRARVLLVDHYDSFVHNLAHHLGALGATVRVERHDAITVDAAQAWDPTHVVLSPGPKGPEATGISPALVKAFDGEVPLLGVCLGHQVLAHVHGGRVEPAPEVVHGRASTIRHDGRSLLQDVPSPLRGARYHSLHVPDPPPGFEPIAWTDDGLLMGIARPDASTVGLAFHPESVLTDHGLRILSAFLAMG